MRTIALILAEKKCVWHALDLDSIAACGTLIGQKSNDYLFHRKQRDRADALIYETRSFSEKLLVTGFLHIFISITSLVFHGISFKEPSKLIKSFFGIRKKIVVDPIVNFRSLSFGNIENPITIKPQEVAIHRLS